MADASLISKQLEKRSRASAKQAESSYILADMARALIHILGIPEADIVMCRDSKSKASLFATLAAKGIQSADLMTLQEVTRLAKRALGNAKVEDESNPSKEDME